MSGGRVAAGGVSAGPTAANKAPTKAGISKPSAESKPSSMGFKTPAGSKVLHGSKASESANAGKLETEIQDMRMNMDTVEKERDFYFGKLRDIELLLQANDTKKTPLTDSVLKILYASEEEKVIIDENGNLTITAGAAGGAVAGNDE